MEQIDLPGGLLGAERIVGVVNFRGAVIVATEYRVLRMTKDEFTELKFEQTSSETITHEELT